MRFYTGQHRYYCGIDLHARTMYLCILDHESGKTVLQRNLRCEPELFLSAIEPYRADLVVGAECIFCWYWLADLCTQEDIPFVLGHALYMKAIHGGKAKNDKIDAHKIAVLLRGGAFPWPTSTHAGCGRPGICSVAGCSSCAVAASSSRISGSSSISSTCRRLPEAP
jgi:hypothetical protein